jgi:pimeloyl-ACP methyl ester carboxylesterase
MTQLQTMPRKSTIVRLSARSPRAVRWLVQRCPRLGALLLAELFVAPRSRLAPLRPLTGASVRELSVGRRRVRVHGIGEGPLVILVHGWQGGASQLVTLAESLRAAGFRVALFDMPAHGEAPGWSTNGVEFVSILEHVAAELGPVHAVVGHSLGGTAALLALARGLPMAGVVAVAPMPSFEFALRSYARNFALSSAARELLERRLEARLGLRREEFDLAQVQLPAPALLVHDRLDRAIPWRQTRRLREGWPGARVFETVGLGHNRVLDAEDVAHTIVEFLCSLPGAGAVGNTLSLVRDGSDDSGPAQRQDGAALEHGVRQRAPA